jgi:biopolymer transport protein ExbD
MAYKRKSNPALKPAKSVFGLNITSMTDMFTILLVFLLQTFSAAEIQLTPDEGMRLPSSTTEKNPTQGVQIFLSTKFLKLEQEELLPITDLKIPTGSERLIQPLFEKLTALKGDENAPDAIKEGKVILLIDRSFSYDEVKKVIHTANQAQFSKIRLATFVDQ